MTLTSHYPSLARIILTLSRSLIAALWMAKCGIKTLIVDKRGADTRNGQGDGIQARTLEILDSFGLADTVWKESYHMGEVRTLTTPAQDLLR